MKNDAKGLMELGTNFVKISCYQDSLALYLFEINKSNIRTWFAFFLSINLYVYEGWNVYLK